MERERWHKLQGYLDPGVFTVTLASGLLFYPNAEPAKSCIFVTLRVACHVGLVKEKGSEYFSL